MLSDDELAELLQDLGSDRVERMADLPLNESIREAICAFANDPPGHGRPGVIFVGAKDSGECSGIAGTTRRPQMSAATLL